MGIPCPLNLPRIRAITLAMPLDIVDISSSDDEETPSVERVIPPSEALFEAISVAQPERLRECLLNLCKKTLGATQLTNAELLAKVQKDDRSVKRPRFVMCKNCQEEFDVTNNIDGDCVYHSGSSKAFHTTQLGVYVVCTS